MNIGEELKRLIKLGVEASAMLCEIEDEAMFKCTIATIIDSWSKEHDGSRLDLIDEIREMMYEVPMDD